MKVGSLPRGVSPRLEWGHASVLSSQAEAAVSRFPSRLEGKGQSLFLAPAGGPGSFGSGPPSLIPACALRWPPPPLPANHCLSASLL